MHVLQAAAQLRAEFVRSGEPEQQLVELHRVALHRLTADVAAFAHHSDRDACVQDVVHQHRQDRERVLAAEAIQVLHQQRNGFPAEATRLHVPQESPKSPCGQVLATEAAHPCIGVAGAFVELPPPLLAVAGWVCRLALKASTTDLSAGADAAVGDPEHESLLAALGHCRACRAIVQDSRLGSDVPGLAAVGLAGRSVPGCLDRT